MTRFARQQLSRFLITLLVSLSWQVLAVPDDLAARMKTVQDAAAQPTVTEPGIHHWTANAEAVPLFSRYQATFQLGLTWKNPYDADEIQVDAQVTRPDGTSFTVPAFYLESWQSADQQTRMNLWVRYQPGGEAPSWCVRLAPDQPGTWTLTIHARSAGQTLQSEAHTFEAVASEHPGYIQVSETNPDYFETSRTKEIFWASGSNIAWTRPNEYGNPPTYEYYLGRADQQMNATRVWLCHWAWLEWMPHQPAKGTNWLGYGGLGYYNQMIADSLDSVLELAEARNIRVMLVTEDNNEVFPGKQKDAWSANPYNQINGGPCKTPPELFSNAVARRHYRNRLRYIVARWGYSPSLWAINAWNDCSNPRPETLNWLQEMHDYVHGLAKDWRPMIYGTNYSYDANQISDYSQSHRQPADNKPKVTQECYFTKQEDAFTNVLSEELWQGLASGRAGVMVWPHPIVDKVNAWPTFKAPIDLAQKLKLNQSTWHPAAIKVEKGVLPAQTGDSIRVVSAAPYGDVPDWGVKAPEGNFKLDLSKSSVWLEGIASKIYGAREDRLDWRNPPVFQVEMPADGHLILEVHEIGNNSNDLVVSLDGKEHFRRNLTDGRRLLSSEERWIKIPIPAGKHAVQVDCQGERSDWIFIRQYLFTYPVEVPADLVQTTGLSNEAGDGFAFLKNLTSDPQLKDVLAMEPKTITGLAVTLPLKEKSVVQALNPLTGEVVQSCEVEPGAALELPPLSWALVLHWQSPGPEQTALYQE